MDVSNKQNIKQTCEQFKYAYTNNMDIAALTDMRHASKTSKWNFLASGGIKSTSGRKRVILQKKKNESFFFVYISSTLLG